MVDGLWTDGIFQMKHMEWRILVIDQPNAEAQMAYDVRLAEEGTPTVRFFRWSRPAISRGWKQPLPPWMDAMDRLSGSIELVERPTGGGLAFHGSDLCCSIVAPCEDVPALGALMRHICHSLVDALKSCGLEVQALLEEAGASRIECCLTDLSPYATLIGGRKACGFAVRRLRACWLVQGSVWLRPLPERLEDAIPPAIRERLSTRAISLEQAMGSPLREEELIARWIEAWETIWRSEREPLEAAVG